MREVDRKYSLKRTKLLKTIFPLLVAAVMIGSAVTGITMNMNVKTTTSASVQTFALGDGVEGDNLVEDIAVDQAGAVEEPQEVRAGAKSIVVWDNDVTQYDNIYRSDTSSNYRLYDDFIFGATQPVMDVHWLGGNWGGGASDEADVVIEFYDDSGDQPGNLVAGPFNYAWGDIYKEGPYSPWTVWYNEVDLPAPVVFNGGQKYWLMIAYEGPGYPYWGWAVHPGILLTNAKQWTGSSFVNAYEDGAFQLTSKFDHDVGLTEIKNPTHGDTPGCPCIPVEVEVGNFGAEDETDVEVNVEIHRNLACTSFPLDDYNIEWNFDATGGNWQFVQQETWFPYVVQPAHGDWMAEFNQHGFDYGAAEMRTHEPINLCGECIDPYLKFYFWHDDYGSDDYMDVWVSTDGKYGNYVKVGGPYERLCCPECPIGWKEYRIDLSEFICNDIWIMFKGHCDGTPSAYNLLLDWVCVFDLEYQATQYVDLDAGEIKQVEFDCWDATCWWCQYENEYVLFWVGAWTVLEGDEFPGNDGFGPFEWFYRPTWIYIPWTHDVGDKAILEPSEPYYMAQPLPMKQLIKNYGKEPEGCFNVYMAVRELDVVTKLNEEFYCWERDPDHYPTYYYAQRPCGWTEVGGYYSDYGWEPWSSNQAGGTAPEACLYYGYARYYSDNIITSPSINTLGEDKLELEFKSFIDWYYGTTYCWMYVECTPDGGMSGWYDKTPWANPISGNVGPDTYTVDITDMIGIDTQVRFRFYGYYFYMDYWYVDDVKLISYTCGDIIWQEKICVDDIQVCEEQELVFPDFIPEPPEPCYCGTVDYCIDSWTKMLDPPDQNPLNDLKRKFITVEFLHDVGIKEFTSPAIDVGKVILWDNGVADGRNGVSNGLWPGTFDREVVDDFENSETWQVTDGHFTLVSYYSGGPGDIDAVDVFFYKDSGGVPETTRYAEESCTITNAYLTGNTFFGRPEVGVEVDFDTVTLPAGTWWVCFYPTMDDNPFWLTSAGWGNNIFVSYPDLGAPKWTPGYDQFGDYYDVNFQLTGTTGGPQPLPDPDIYVPCEEIDVCVLIENLGTYDEDAIVWYKFYEYQPAKTLLFEGSVGQFIESLSEEEVCLFTFDFSDEGVYEVEVEVTIPKDCNLDNNGPISLIIGADCCGPESCFILDPEEPDGENNWYLSKVTVSAYAWDVCEVQSGIAKIVYIVDGVEDFIPGDNGEFVIEGDGVHFIEIYAIDNVGNEEEDHHTFEVAIDSTAPTCDLQHDEYKDEAGTWFVHFQAIANDATSGMNRVEFFIDGALQLTDDTGPFEWTIEWDPDYKTKTFYAYAYDNAGNSADDNVPGSEIPIGNSKPKDHSQTKTKTLSRTLVTQTPKGIF
jgi:hypothetical protein